MIAFLVLLQAATAETPAAAPIDNLHHHVVEAIRNCPAHQAGEIVVCSRDRGVAEAYRLPRLDSRFAGANLRPSGRGTVDGREVGQVGAGSCSNVGAGGGTGCTLKAARSWAEWKKQRAAEGQAFPW